MGMTIRPMLPAAAALLLLAPLGARELVVRQAGAALTADCEDGSPVVAELPAGQPLKLRFAIAGASSRCYSVSAELDGRILAGYIDKAAVGGLDAFEQERKASSVSQIAAGAVRSIRLSPPPAASTTAPAPAGERAALDAAIQALDAETPQKVPTLLAGLPSEHRSAAVLRAQAYLQMTRPPTPGRRWSPPCGSEATRTRPCWGWPAWPCSSRTACRKPAST